MAWLYVRRSILFCPTKLFLAKNEEVEGKKASICRAVGGQEGGVCPGCGDAVGRMCMCQQIVWCVSGSIAFVVVSPQLPFHTT